MNLWGRPATFARLARLARLARDTGPLVVALAGACHASGRSDPPSSAVAEASSPASALPAALLSGDAGVGASGAPRPVTASRKLPNPVAYIPPQCYTRTEPDEGGPAHNPCYVCHTRAEPPNYVDDASFQVLWSLPAAARDNPWTNLFSPPITRARPRTDEEVLAHVRRSNYFERTAAASSS